MAQGRERLDHWALKAQKDGYPARSVYKLEEIHTKFKVLNKGARVVDVGSSPGSWSLWCLRRFQAEVWGVDLNPLGAGVTVPPGFHFRQGDIFDESVADELAAAAPFDVFLSDAAAPTTGNRTVDTGRSFLLCERALDLAGRLLKPGGHLVFKIFQGGDEPQLWARLKTEYQSAQRFKPQAVRSDSFETYFIGLGRKEIPS